MFCLILAADIKTGGAKNQKMENNEEKKKKSEKAQPSVLLSAQLALNEIGDKGAKHATGA